MERCKMSMRRKYGWVPTLLLPTGPCLLPLIFIWKQYAIRSSHLHTQPSRHGALLRDDGGVVVKGDVVEEAGEEDVGHPDQ